MRNWKNGTGEIGGSTPITRDYFLFNICEPESQAPNTESKALSGKAGGDAGETKWSDWTSTHRLENI